MKVRLSIAVPPGPAQFFEHPGPVIRIGRDPSCELRLENEVASGVSRQHACITLSDRQATIADVGSSNGTLLNGKLLDNPAPLQVGDSIQLGYTGPTLQILEMKLEPPPAAAPPRPATAPARPAAAPKRTAAPPRADSRTRVLLGVAGGGIVLVLAAALLLFRRAPQAAEGPASASKSGALAAGEAKPEREPAAPAARDAERPARDSASAFRPDRSAPADPNAPSEEVKPIGTYVAPPNWVCVLVQRKGEAYPWTVLRPESRVSTATTLVSLSGYRSLVALDSGLDLTLWGNLPEFSPSPPVLESVAMLHVPAGGRDLDLTLDRGRVVITNRKPNGGAAQVRCRFLGEIWDLELPNAQSEVALERWTLPGAVPSTLAPQSVATSVGLYTKGPVRLRTPHQTLALADLTRVGWNHQTPTLLHQAALKEPPDWWAKAPDPKAPGVQKALRSLLDWRQILGGRPSAPAARTGPTEAEVSVIATIKTQVEEVRDPDNQDLGIFFLAALDEIEPLIGFLKDRQNPNVRGVTIFAMQSWLSRGSQHADDLMHILQRRGDSRERAERVVRLLHFLPIDALDQRRTYEELIDLLSDDDLLVRNLAYWHLNQVGGAGRLPEEVRKIDYDPAWEPDKRRAGVEQWKRLLAEGKIPTPRR